MATSIAVQSGDSPENHAKIAEKSHSSVYDIVTERILIELESGVVPWRRPWRTLPPANLVSKKHYRGINTFLLGLAGYGSQYWLTYRQAQALGGNVRKGEHGTKIVFWKFDKYETETADGETEKPASAFLRYYVVFNLEQTEGLKALLALPPARPIESAEAIVTGMPNPPAFEQDFRASYIPSTDTVTMPSRTAFNSHAEYYSTLFHELTHSTGHAKRLAREGFDKPQMFGSDSYSREELILLFPFFCQRHGQNCFRPLTFNQLCLTPCLFQMIVLERPTPCGRFPHPGCRTAPPAHAVSTPPCQLRRPWRGLLMVRAATSEWVPRGSAVPIRACRSRSGATADEPALS